jgi:ribose-phosphate pyrophosphokinase
MTKPLILAMPGNEGLTQSLSRSLGFETGILNTRTFPDSETYLRFDSDVRDRRVVLVCTLDHPNEKFLPLRFAAATARDLGAAKVSLIAPYLAYMRQDQRFKPGEAVTSRQFALLLSETFDWLVTVDPHLHRYHSLNEIYSIPARAVHAAPLVSQWIKANVANPLLIGPDSESEQWVAAVAKDAESPFTVLEKERHGDRDVKISVKNLQALSRRTPVLIDDIISSGRTMIEAVRLVAPQGAAQPICVAVHGLFADHSEVLLARAGAGVVTANTIPHGTNGIDVTGLIKDAVRDLLANT